MMIRENLLHFVWKHQKLPLGDLYTSSGEKLMVLRPGLHNHLSGPDFFNAQVVIGTQEWAGNIEMHVKASDWYVHGHEKDPKYNTVILHIVWENDIDIFRNDTTRIPTLVLKEYLSSKLLMAHEKLLNKKEHKFINCEKEIGNLSHFLIKNWMDSLFIERLEEKTRRIEKRLKQFENDWEQLTFILLLKNFGSKINGNSFHEIGKGLNFSMIRKIRHDRHQLESVLFGMAGLLENTTIFDRYYTTLQDEFHFLKSKWNLKQHSGGYPEFFRLRPTNFPTIRLSQFAGLYEKHNTVFGKLMAAETIAELRAIFEISASIYWKDHFTFGKVSKSSTKRLSKAFIDLLIINTIIPLKFCYSRYRGEDVSESLLAIGMAIKKEHNSIVTNFETLKIPIAHAMHSQAILQLYTSYCSANRCLQCAIGSNLMHTAV
ncbi:DUF2851 family protein [Spongiimicrobium salis]|uniref:DUF2851 family protein n=1 Tax=Spongiimicrobium salis TaxID=1667022 RepID=UPI00374DD743